MEQTLEDLAGALARGRRLMGLDLGTATIGVAVSDALLSIASPVTTIRRTRFKRDAEELAALVEKRQAGGLVYGLPVNMDGTEGSRCQSTREFAREFAKRCPLPYAFWDERLSTAAVQRMLTDEMDMSRKRRAEVVDRAAAAYILQGALDAIRKRRGPQAIAPKF
jgi:putative Holliday junction resolvase